jgi:hypothetical protein
MKEKESSGANLLERALEPFEEKLKAQEEFRRRLGVKQVDRPTYDRYITGPIEKIDSRRNLFLRDRRENPFADGFPERFQERTGFDSYRDEIPLARLDREERIAFSLHKAPHGSAGECQPQSRISQVVHPGGEMPDLLGDQQEEMDPMRGALHRLLPLE